MLTALTMGDPADAATRLCAREGSTDIDLFVVADDEKHAQKAFKRVYTHLKSRLSEIAMIEQEVGDVPQHGFTMRHRKVHPTRCTFGRDEHNNSPRSSIRRDASPHSHRRCATSQMLLVRSQKCVTFFTGWPQVMMA